MGVEGAILHRVVREGILKQSPEWSEIHVDIWGKSKPTGNTVKVLSSNVFQEQHFSNDFNHTYGENSGKL